MPTNETGTLHFKRYHVEIDPATLVMLYTVTLVADLADRCISDTTEEEDVVIRADLQAVYPRCFPKLVLVTPQ